MTSKWNDTRKQPFSPAGQHRSFLPPSHYAAAGGFAYPVKRQEPKTSESSWGHRSGSGLRNRLDEGTSTPKGEARVGPAESGSESSLDYRRTQSASKGQSGGKVAGPSRIQHDQRPGLPNVESELLPSLQTTINKMTRPPSRLPTISTPKAHGQSLHKPKSTPKLAGGSNNLEYHPSVPSIEARQKLPKPSLKSALRTPMQTVQKMTMSPLPPPPEVPKVPSPRTPSLRTVRSLLSRKPSTTPQQPTTPLPAVKPLNITSKSTPSNLPRPKPKLEHTPSQSTVTDESDLEKQYERQWMDKRRLTVANAEVLPSTSSSESDVQVPYRHEPWLSNVRSPPMAFSISRPPTPQPTSKANIGLGLELASESPLIPSHAFSERAKILRFSLPPSDSDASLASNRHLSYPGSWDDSDYSTGGEDGDRRGASDSAESGLEEDNSEEEQWAQDPVQWPQYQSLRRPNQKPTSWNQKPLSPRVTEQPSTPISISQLLSRRQGSYHSSPLSSPLTPKANHDFSTPRAKPERQQALSSPSRTPRANEKTSKPMVPVRSPKPKDDHTWFNESSHELENGFQAPTPRVISRKSPPSLHPKPRVTLAQETTFHAFHQRQAFGIPPSNSDEIYNGQSSKRWSEGSSQRSSVSSNTWQWDDDAPLDSRNEESSLSVGAESMLRSLSNDSKDRETETFKQSSAHQEVPRFSVVSATSTGSSMYDDHHLTDSSDSEFEDARQDYCFGDGSLQSPGERRQHHHRQNEHQHSVRLVSKRPEPANANRREVILQEFMESEETFLDNAQYCIDNFILPIRTQDRRSWIGGVPADISRLLDWYEDIVNLHMCILQTLESSMSTQGPGSSTINGLPGYLKDFVPRLHVYQPYLVRLADVLEEVAKLASNTDSDFGEFIRMQERILKPKGWTFEGLLMEPVHRLAAYQDMFTDLLDHTPQSHPEFLASYTLAKSVDTVMKVLTEVKLRENEYKLIQTLASQISDSAVGDSLATRERRLLYSGTVRLISHALPPPVTPSGLSSPQLSRVGKPTNRLVEAISVWERSPKRSDSVKSTSSSITASMKSFNTASSGSASINLDGASRLPKLKDMFKRKPSRTGLSNSSVDSSSAHPTTIIPPDHVQAFVFSDLLLLITPRQSSASQYDLVPGVGLSRIFSVSQTSVDNPQGQWPSHAPNAAKPTTTNSRTEFTLQLIPTPRAVNTNGAASIPASTPLTSAVVEIVLKSDSQEGSGERTPASAELVESFSKALEQSTRHTQRLLSFSGFQDAANFRSDSSKDTWLTVSSLMASGLPMPKSPSGELPDLKYGQEDEEAKKMEREERGWWTLRYQQVLGEMHRQCVFTASTTTTTTTGR